MLKLVLRQGAKLSLIGVVIGVLLAVVLAKVLALRLDAFLYDLSPTDPMTSEADWGMRSYQDDWDSDNWGRENVYDVYSLSDMRALDDTYYKDW